jgi:hypothetical protein
MLESTDRIISLSNGEMKEIKKENEGKRKERKEAKEESKL